MHRSLRMVFRVVMIALTATLSLFAAADAALAGKFNPTLNVGDAAPDWKDLPGVDDKKHSLADYADKQVLVVVFTCNTCPTAVDYEDRIMQLAKKYASDGKAGVVAINPNQVADDLLPKMQERAKSRGFNYAYLHDDTQQVAKSYGALVTPEFFVLDAKRRVVYMGALDDSTEPSGVKTRYVEAAIDATLNGAKPEVTETVGRGCLVRYARERRKK